MRFPKSSALRPPARAVPVANRPVYLPQRRRLRLRPQPKPPAAFAFGDSKGPKPVAEYKVAPGDTLWDIARMHGTTVAAIREANGMASKDNTITEGELLVIPASGESPDPPANKQAKPRSQAAPQEAAAPGVQGQQQTKKPANKSCVSLPGMSPVQRRSYPDLWQAPRSMVKGIGLEDCEQLMHDNLAGLLDKDVLLVVYAPWCPYCKDMEASLEDLAKGLCKDKSVAVLKMRGDSAAGRLWLRAQLGVETFPSVIGFPQDGGGPLRYIGSRDAASLLQFMNLHCRSINVGAQQLRLEPPSPMQQLLDVGGGWPLRGALLVATVAMAALAVRAMQGVPADATERAKAVEKRKKPAGAVATSDLEEVDQSIRNLLKVLFELLALRLEVMLNNMDAVLRRVWRFLTGPGRGGSGTAAAAGGQS